MLPLINAFGATAPYWEDRPLIMTPGETKSFPIILQNMVGEKDITLKAEITSGKEIASLIDSNLNYKVPFERKDIEANLKIEIPEKAKNNQEYEVKILFKQTSTEEGMLKITGGVTSSFPVIVKEISENPEIKTKSSSAKIILTLSILVIIIAIIIITIILITTIRKNKNLKLY